MQCGFYIVIHCKFVYKKLKTLWRYDFCLNKKEKPLSEINIKMVQNLCWVQMFGKLNICSNNDSIVTHSECCNKTDYIFVTKVYIIGVVPTNVAQCIRGLHRDMIAWHTFYGKKWTPQNYTSIKQIKHPMHKHKQKIYAFALRTTAVGGLKYKWHVNYLLCSEQLQLLIYQLVSYMFV